MAWIDPFDVRWLSWLEARHAERRSASRLLLLLDGVFVPGLHARMRDVVTSRDECASVFEHLGSYTEEARAVTPFVIAFDPANRSMAALLRECDGQPMVSCIETDDSAARWAGRLSRWSVVDIGDSAFHFRLADTRRLPAIARTLRPAQQRDLLGAATAWHCVDRTGRWQALPLRTQRHADEPAEPAILDDQQFATLLQDSEADEMLAVLDARSVGLAVSVRPSWRHATVEAVLRRADAEGVRATSDRLQRVEVALSDRIQEQTP